MSTWTRFTQSHYHNASLGFAGYLTKPIRGRELLAEDLELVGEAANGLEALDLLAVGTPPCVVVLEDPDRDGADMRAASGYFTFFPSEFSKLVAGYERFIPRGDERSLNRFVIQATFALGPHKPHPF